MRRLQMFPNLCAARVRFHDVSVIVSVIVKLQESSLFKVIQRVFLIRNVYADALECDALPAKENSPGWKSNLGSSNTCVASEAAVYFLILGS